MEVIGAGYGRTGTLSMRAALTQLLDGPCYHMKTLVEEPKHIDYWYRWAQNPTQSPDWDQILQGMRAGVDAPICFFVDELMERHPDAKVVLTTRDPEKWLRSFKSLMRANIQSSWMGLFSSRVRRFGKFGRTMCQHFIGKMDDQRLLDAFEAHNAHIRQVVPPSRLLEMRVQDGWGPLCEFLGKPVPNTPFPHENEGTKVIRRGHWDLAFNTP